MKILMQAEHGQMKRNCIYDVPKPLAEKLIDEGFANAYSDPDEERKRIEPKAHAKGQPKKETADVPIPETS